MLTISRVRGVYNNLLSDDNSQQFNSRTFFFVAPDWI